MRVRNGAATAVAGLALSVASLTPSAAHAVSSPAVMTMSSWEGVTLGSSLTAVAAEHGWGTSDCGDGVPAAISGLWQYGIEVAVGETPGRVGFIEVSGAGDRGPRGLRIGERTSAVAALLRRGVRRRVDLGVYGGWSYWLIRVRVGYLYVRTGDGNGSGSPRRVWSFGLADSKALADSRGRTQGGCI